MFRCIAHLKKIQLKQAGNSDLVNKPAKRDDRIRHEKFPSLILNVNSSETGFFCYRYKEGGFSIISALRKINKASERF